MGADAIDPELAASAFDGAEFPPEARDLAGETGEMPCAVETFFENAKFDAAMGKAGAAIQLQAQTQNIDQIFKNRTHAAPPAVDAEHRLEKRDSHAWIHTRMATFGKSASEVIDDWCEEFPHRKAEIEAELRAVAAQLDAAA